MNDASIEDPVIQRCSCNSDCYSKDSDSNQWMLRVIQQAESISEIRQNIGDVQGLDILVEKATNGCLRDRTRALAVQRSFEEYLFGELRVCCSFLALRWRTTARLIANTA